MAEAGALAGRVVLVTGAGRGIGRAAALHLAQEGAAVAINDVDGSLASDAARAVTEAGGQALAVPGSVADWDTAAAMAAETVARFGRLDGLVNNAGLHYQALPWEEEPARVRAVVEVNVLGSLHCAIQASRWMREQGGGSIVNIVSGAALGAPNRAVYGATKGALISFTYGLARDLAPCDIRVNALAPLAATRMTDPALGGGDHGARAGEFSSLANPALIAPAIAWLLSPAAAGVTGEVIRFTGRELSLIKPPALSETAREAESWTAEAFVDALSAIAAASLR